MADADLLEPPRSMRPDRRLILQHTLALIRRLRDGHPTDGGPASPYGL